MKSGIYRIHNRMNGKTYISQSLNVNRRIQEHLKMISKGTHHSRKLQEDYNHFGLSSFRFEQIKICEAGELDHMEAHYIKEYHSIEKGYNIFNNKSSITEKKDHETDAWRFEILNEHLDLIDDVILIAVNRSEAFKYARALGEKKGGVVYRSIPISNN